MNPTLYYLLADLTLLLHLIFVAFVVIGLLLILLGKVLDWSWVRNPWFRTTHLVAITLVILQAWFGIICPLTILEMELRSRAGEATYAGSFVSHWLEMILYYQGPAWAFGLVYTLFGLAVIASWFWVHPRRFRRKPG